MNGSSGEPPPTAVSGLLVPLVIWGNSPPQSKISVVKFLNDNTTIVTGSENGHLIIWMCGEDALTPHQLMIGHDTCITAISPTSTSSTSSRFISASSDGQLCLWDVSDGRCIDSVSTIYLHRHMQPYVYKSSRHTRSTRLFCIGDYTDFVVLDPQDLAIVFNLSSRVEPDWICSYSFVQRTNKPEQCIGLSMAGMIKIWSLLDLEKRDMATPLYEDESKRLDIRDIKEVAFSSINERIFLIVSANTWQIVDLEDLSVVLCFECTMKALGGTILDVDKVAITYSDHSLRIYQLPLEMLNGTQVRQSFGANPKNYFGIAKPFEIAVLDGSKEKTISWMSDVWFSFSQQKDDPTLFQVARASHNSRLLLWKIPRFDSEFMNKLSNDAQLPLVYKGTFEESLQSIWDCLNEDSDSAMPTLDGGQISSSLFVPSQGKLLLGRKDGLIVMTYACETLSRQLLNLPPERPTSRRLVGHTAAVTQLLYPHEEDSRFDAQMLLSGSDDFSVILWNLTSASRIYRFTVHGGPILRFLIPPPNTSKQMSKCICAVAADNSVSLLNIRDNKCCLLASRHPHPVREVKWRPLDDFMLVRLDDGSVYVWQMETANMDRVVTGLMAEEVMAACDEQAGMEEGTDETAANNAVQLMRAIRHKNIDAVKQRVGGGGDGRNKNGDDGSIPLGSPMSVTPLSGCSQGAHIIHFEVGSLIGGIVNIDCAQEAALEEQSINRETADRSEITRRLNWQLESNLYLDVARLMLSLLHAWNLDEDLDAVCIKKLGLHKPRHELYFGNVSRHGQLSVVLPSRIRRSFDSFANDIRWQASHSLTTTHLLAIISTSNTLMEMKNTGAQIRSRKLAPAQPQLIKQISKENMAAEKQHVKQGWSLVAALHCVLLPDHVRPKSSYAAPRIELLARRWQDQCVEIREAAQALLIRELSRLGSNGRRRLIESWAPFLPPLLHPTLSIFGARLQSSVPALPAAPPIPPRQKNAPLPQTPIPEPTTGEDGESGVQQVRRNQATAIILLGVVGAEFGDELYRAELTRATALSLLELLVAAPSALLPVHSPLRRAAIDLLGRGFVHWEPHLEISKVLLGLLDLAANSERQPVPSLAGAPLTPIADACRTARHALSLIAAARPPAFLTALSMEVARYNSAAQHQTIQHTVTSPLLKSRSEVLRIMDELSEKKYNDMVEMMIPVGDVLVHCLDTSLLKNRTLGDIFPPITKFNMVGYCAATRRIAFGGTKGTCLVHELRAAKSHSLAAHSGPVTAVAFSEDGKYLATYGGEDAKINFYQTSQTFLGMGQSQMKLSKCQLAPSYNSSNTSTSGGQSSRPRLVWINSKSIALLLPNGSEQRFTI